MCYVYQPHVSTSRKLLKSLHMYKVSTYVYIDNCSLVSQEDVFLGFAASTDLRLIQTDSLLKDQKAVGTTPRARWGNPSGVVITKAESSAPSRIQDTGPPKPRQLSPWWYTCAISLSRIRIHLLACKCACIVTAHFGTIISANTFLTGSSARAHSLHQQM